MKFGVATTTAATPGSFTASSGFSNARSPSAHCGYSLPTCVAARDSVAGSASHTATSRAAGCSASPGRWLASAIAPAPITATPTTDSFDVTFIPTT